jgi:quercetin dioxygenase-like cupin family protein
MALHSQVGVPVRQLLVAAACLLGSTSLAASETPSDAVVVDNPSVRVVRTSRPPAPAEHPAAVVVPLHDGAARKAGEAYWTGDASLRSSDAAAGPFIVVELKSPALPATPGTAEKGTKPGEQPSTGLSFRPLFENERVAVLRARMEVGAKEGFHTHARDIIVVHLSGGAVEDTAEGETKVNHWKRGDVEFEGRGTSHSARNAGGAIDVVLVTLKP